MTAAQRPVRLAILLAAFVLQNLEECLWLPNWAAQHVPALPPITQAQFAVATALLTTIAATFLALIPLLKSKLGTMFAALIAGALLANAMTHVLLSLLTLSLMPGAISGIFLQGPAAAWVLAGLGLKQRGWALSFASGLALTPPFALASLAIAKFLVN